MCSKHTHVCIPHQGRGTELGGKGQRGVCWLALGGAGKSLMEVLTVQILSVIAKATLSYCSEVAEILVGQGSDLF